MIKGVCELSADYVRSILDYDHKTGRFTYKKRRGRLNVGDVAGYLESNGYIQIKIDNKAYLAHRLAWLYVTGEWPEGQIDHIDLDKSNNSWPNLRQANNSLNQANRRRRKDNSSGYKGVFIKRHRKSDGKPIYRAEIVKDYKRYDLGHFDSATDASLAYSNAAERLFGEFARPQ